MTKREWPAYMRAMRKEKDPQTALRMRVVYAVKHGEMKPFEVAESFGVSVRSVYRWLGLYEEKGIKGLLTGKRTGRPPLVDKKELDRAVPELTKPESLYSEDLRDAIEHIYGVRYSLRQIRRIFRRNRQSSKRPTPTHIRRPKRREMIKGQKELWEFLDVSRAEGRTVVAEDECYLLRDLFKSSRRWSAVGIRDRRRYTGSHDKICVFGACTEFGKVFFGFYDVANSETYCDFMEYLYQELGPLAVVCDRFGPHMSAYTENRLKDYDIVHHYNLPGCPELNPQEIVWYQMRLGLEKHGIMYLGKEEWKKTVPEIVTKLEYKVNTAKSFYKAI